MFRDRFIIIVVALTFSLLGLKAGMLNQLGSNVTNTFGNMQKNVKYEKDKSALKKKFKEFDKLMNQNRYGDIRWESQLKSRMKNLIYATKSFEKKYPGKAKNAWGGIKRRMAIIQKRANEARKKRLALEKEKKRKEEAKRKAKLAAAKKRQKQKAKKTAAKKQTATKVASGLVAQVKQFQAKQKKSGTCDMLANKKVDGKETFTRDKFKGVYVVFNNNYNDKDKEQYEFGDKDYIYAHIHFPKPLNKILPTKTDLRNFGTLYYFKSFITLKEKGKYSGRKSKGQTDNIPLLDEYLNKKVITVPVVPDRSFYIALAYRYAKNGKFPNDKVEEKAWQIAQMSIFPKNTLEFLSQLDKGKKVITASFKFLSKFNRSYFESLEKIKGEFVLNVTKEGKNKYATLAKNIHKWEFDLAKKESEVALRLDKKALDEKMASMTPREREMFKIAFNSPYGYMEPYEGKKYNVTFHYDPARSAKLTAVEFTWPKGDCEKCEAGHETLTFFKGDSKTIPVPAKAKITINGKTAIAEVTRDEVVNIMWWY